MVLVSAHPVESRFSGKYELIQTPVVILGALATIRHFVKWQIEPGRFVFFIEIVFKIAVWHKMEGCYFHWEGTSFGPVRFGLWRYYRLLCAAVPMASAAPLAMGEANRQYLPFCWDNRSETGNDRAPHCRNP